MEEVAARDSEFQAVIIVEYDDGRLFPLTETIPRCLVPIANRPLLAYQLDMLAKSKIAETFIVAPSDYEVQFSKFLADYKNTSGMFIELIFVDEMMGSADGLRAVSGSIRGDFFCLSADFVSQFSLSDLANLHRISTSDITITIVQSPKDASRDDIDQEYIGLGDGDRVLMKTPALEIDGVIDIQKAAIQRAGRLRLRSDQVDIGIYLISHWLLKFVVDNKRISSIRNDLLPFLISRQFQSKDYLLTHIPALESRRRPLEGLESWLTSCRSKGVCPMKTILEARTEQESGNGSSKKPANSTSCDLLRCFALVYEISALATAGSSTSSGTGSSQKDGTTPSIICTRLTNLASYMALSKDIPQMVHTSRVPWERAANYLTKEQTVIGSDTDISDKTVTVKQCSIGSHVKIGARTKLNNCVILDNAVIGENCVLQNSIICDRAVIENGCNLNECNVGSGYRVIGNTKVRGESFSTVSQASLV